MFQLLFVNRIKSTTKIKPMNTIKKNKIITLPLKLILAVAVILMPVVNVLAWSEFFPSCESHTTITDNLSCPGSCTRAVVTCGQCTATGWSCPGPGSGTYTAYSGTCVLLAGVGDGCVYSCENFVQTRSNSCACPC